MYEKRELCSLTIIVSLNYAPHRKAVVKGLLKQFRRFPTMAACLGDELAEAVRTSRVLVVGTGGIGCELVKNLVLSGFPDIVMVSYDACVYLCVCVMVMIMNT